MIFYRPIVVQSGEINLRKLREVDYEPQNGATGLEKYISSSVIHNATCKWTTQRELPIKGAFHDEKGRSMMLTSLYLDI